MCMLMSREDDDILVGFAQTIVAGIELDPERGVRKRLDHDTLGPEVVVLACDE